MISLNKKHYLFQPVFFVRTTISFAVVLVVLAISTLAVRASESSLRATIARSSTATISTLVPASGATLPPSSAAVPPAMPSSQIPNGINMMSGNASWYGSVLRGHKTASGEIFDEHKLTAAHRTLPFGTMVLVTDLLNHQTVIVKITDRGALFSDRAIDLSYAAAAKLDMVRAGVHPVRLTILAKNDPVLTGWTPLPRVENPSKSK